MSEFTPETNVAILGPITKENTSEVVSAWFARNLERERNKIIESYNISTSARLMSEYKLNDMQREIDLLKEDLRRADCEYIETIKELTRIEEENESLKERLESIKEGFEGCCYACEPVGLLNQKLEEQLKAIEEDGTSEHNAAFDLRCQIAECLVRIDDWKNIAKKLYSVVLHIDLVSKKNSIVVIGPSLREEIHSSIKDYEMNI
jgi:chromosome segregation ATPase